MNAQCSRCHQSLEAAWSFCPKCGAATEAGQPAVAQESEHHPVRWAFGGLFYGLLAAPILIVTGIMICLTGWGLFLGVPVIALGVLAPLAGPLFGMSERAAKCPECGTRVITLADGQVHACPACNAQFAVVKERHAHSH
jgi:Zn finger protein HypA/HybF involved in hydrogenase expression